MSSSFLIYNPSTGNVFSTTNPLHLMTGNRRIVPTGRLIQRREADRPALYEYRDVISGELYQLERAPPAQILVSETSPDLPSLESFSGEISPLPVPSRSIPDNLIQLSYETLIKQLYGLPVELPDYLVINNIQNYFISFEQIQIMLSQNKIDRMIIDPLLQPWAGPPTSEYRILTFFGKDGLIYLVKAKYNSQTNEIFP